jgi:hypothetical protein
MTTLNEAVLAKLADWRPSGRSIQQVPDGGSGWTLHLTADRCDELGCLVWDASLRKTTPPADRGADALRQWANQVASRVTGLLEPLRVVEVDGSRDEALLRSQEPTDRSGQLSYYEVRLRGRGEATIGRYRASHAIGSKREQIAFAITHEGLAKLCADLTCVE